jgi:hypothetical protein
VPDHAPTQLSVSKSELVVTLTWTDNTSNESSFQIERAIGDGFFEILDYAPANTTSYDDRNVTNGTSYSYRVTAVNASGQSEYSNIAQSGVVTGIEEFETNTAVYPNPVKDFVHVRYNEAVTRFSVFQLDGRLVEAAFPQSNEFKINMSNYASGLYVLQVEFAHGRKAVKLFKQ